MAQFGCRHQMEVLPLRLLLFSFPRVSLVPEAFLDPLGIWEQR